MLDSLRWDHYEQQEVLGTWYVITKQGEGRVFQLVYTVGNNENFQFFSTQEVLTNDEGIAVFCCILITFGVKCYWWDSSKFFLGQRKNKRSEGRMG